MLCYLSFSNYLWVSLLVIALYYAIVITAFYRKNKLAPALAATKTTATDSSNQDPLVFDLVDEMQALIEQAAVQKSDKQELKGFLQSLLQKYPSLKSSPLKDSIIHLIGVESENKMSIEFSAEELERLWM